MAMSKGKSRYLTLHWQVQLETSQAILTWKSVMEKRNPYVHRALVLKRVWVLDEPRAKRGAATEGFAFAREKGRRANPWATCGTPLRNRGTPWRKLYPSCLTPKPYSSELAAWPFFLLQGLHLAWGLGGLTLGFKSYIKSTYPLCVRNSEIEKLRMLLQLMKKGSYIAVTGGKGVGKSCLINTALNRHCGVVYITVSYLSYSILPVYGDCFVICRLNLALTKT